MDTVDNECWKKAITETHVDYDLMHNLVFDFLVTEGYHDVAQTFKNEVKSSGLRTKLPEIEINEKTDVQKQIRNAILTGEIKLAESIVNRQYPELLDDDHLLHFYLQIQHLIELIRQAKSDEAVEFAQEDIVEKGDYPECLPDLERAMGLLAFPDPEKSPFAELLQPGFRLKVWSRVHEAILALEQKRSNTNLSSSLKYLMWSEKQLQDRQIPFYRFENFTE